MIFYVSQRCGAFLDDGQKVHFEFCRVNYEVYRNDVIRKKKLYKLYGEDNFIVIPRMDYEEIVRKFLKRISKVRQQWFHAHNMPQSDFDFCHAFHCFYEETGCYEEFAAFEKSILCKFAVEWCEEQGIAYTLEEPA